MASPFLAAPAGTPVAPSTSARYYYRRQVFSRNPITETNWGAGKTVNFQAEASGGHFLVPQETRIVARITVQGNGHIDDTNDQKLAKSVRFATDPVTNMFSAASLSIGGTTVESHAANVADVSQLQLRTEHTKAGADGPGSAGLLSFNQKMTHEDVTSVTLDNLAGGSNTAAVAAAAGADSLTALNTGVYHTTDERSDKHELLLNNSSGSSKANGAAATPIEISAPMGNLFTFARQEKSFIPNVNFLMQLTINPDYASDMFFSEQLRGEASNAAVRTRSDTVFGTVGGRVGNVAGEAHANNITANVNVPVYIQPVERVTAAPKVTINELFLDCMYAVPAVPVPPPVSMQIPYQAMTVYTRTLTNSKAFTESFSGIPPSVGAIIIGLRSTAHTVNTNRELYSLGGDAAKGIKSLSLSLGSLQLPQPAYVLDFSERQIGRLFADWLSFTGGSASNGVGGDSLSEFCKSPLAAFRVLQDPGSYASTAIVRMETKADVGTDAELVVACVHQKVFEAYWQDGETFPSRVVVDDVLN